VEEEEVVVEASAVVVEEAEVAVESHKKQKQTPNQAQLMVLVAFRK
jgi:hypothetical protein